MIFSIPKFTGKALEFASNSIWLSGQKVVFFPWFMGMCYLMIMSCTFLKCQLDFGALKTQINPGCSLEGLMLKLKLQYFGHLMRRADSFEKTLLLGKIEGRRRRGQQRMRWLDGITDSMDMSLVDSGSWWWTGRPGVLQSMGSQRVGHDWATKLIWRHKLEFHNS